MFHTISLIMYGVVLGVRLGVAASSGLGSFARSSSNAIGFANSQPCAYCTPRSRKNCACASVSTPSAIISSFSDFAISMMCNTTWLVAAPVPRVSTNDLSIFR